MMFTTGIQVKMYPRYRKIAMRFKQHPEEFKLALAKAWFKLTDPDMGSRVRYLDSVEEERFVGLDSIRFAVCNEHELFTSHPATIADKAGSDLPTSTLFLV